MSTTQKNDTPWLNPALIVSAINRMQIVDGYRVKDVLDKAGEAKGLTVDEAAVLMAVKDPEQLGEMFALAKQVKETIYGRRIVLFAPMYISSHCGNECLYCAFRASNKDLTRRALTGAEIAAETGILVNQGHKRVLMVAGESYEKARSLGYILDSIAAIYDVRGEKAGAQIRRVNVNLAPLDREGFKALEQANIGTYQVFQETYHQENYAKLHVSGRKADFGWRANVMHRAIEAGVGDVGMGVLYGLSDWRFDTLALLQHNADLESRYGVGAHTISVPRLEPAHGAPLASTSPNAVSDDDFRKLVAVIRLAVPHTGLIMSTRENAAIRQEALELGVSQISAGSRTNPGGYAEAKETETFEASQFQLGDHRTLDEVVYDLTSRGFVPSNCTACDELGRMGKKFMKFATTGEIKKHCGPNAVSTLSEYADDYASPQTRKACETLIGTELKKLPPRDRSVAERLLKRVRAGERGCHC